MDTIEVRILKPEEYPLWDKLFELSPQGSIFSSYGWLSTSSQASTLKLFLLGCFEKDDLVGCCPLFSSKILGTFSSYSNVCGMMPFSGIVIKEYSEENVRKHEQFIHQIQKSFLNYFSSIRCSIIKINNPPNLTDVRPFLWNDWDCDLRYTYQIDLMDLNYSRDVRRNIKKANESEIVVERSSDLEKYFSLFKMTFKNQGMHPPVSYDYLKKMYDYLIQDQCGELWVAATPDGAWICAEIFLSDNKFVHRWTAATDITLRKTGGYHLLLDRAFQYYSQKGIKTINLMAGNTPQLSEFITGFNPELVPYYSVQKSRGLFRVFNAMRSIIR